MTQNNYPSFDPKKPKEAIDLLTDMVKQRRQDVNDFNNLQNRFITGRIVGRIPTGAADLQPGDKVGDTNFEASTSYLYRIVDNSGTPVWARIQMDMVW